MTSKNGMKRLTSEQTQDIQVAFDQLDVDRDGHVFFDDVCDLLRLLGQNPTEKEISDITKRHSSGTNERLNINAIYRLLEDIGLKNKEEVNQEMADAFRKIDKSGDGFISKVELRNFLIKHQQDIVNELEFDAIMMSADVNKDGKIDYKEFVKFLTSQ